MTKQADLLHRFLLERAGVRGALVRLTSSWQEVASRAAYPQRVREWLGQGLAASALLTANVKVQGQLSLELKSSGSLRLLFAECSEAGRLRGLARWDASASWAAEPDLSLLPEAVLAITLGDVERGHRYQGLVELTAPTLAASLENYFAQSEQLPTRLHLAADAHRAVGLLLQKLPDAGGHDGEVEVGAVDADGWNRVQHLLATLDPDELLDTPAETLLYRLFHEDTVRLFDPHCLQFGCSCSAQRVQGMLRSLGRAEVEAALGEQAGQLEVTCEFCAQRYTFDSVDIARVFSDNAVAPGTPTAQ